MRFAQIRDRVEIADGPAQPVSTTGLTGTWVNTNPDTNGIARMAMSESGGKLSLRTYAVGPDGPVDWGAADVTVFASTASSRNGAGFTCTYDFGFAETRLQGMIMKGLLVLAQFHSFKDGSRRAGYFVREYYALEHGRF
ncbi:MAG: hypothetical protein QOE33_115 [Acidobacteriota bacterium]|nr:hypothetical protein [Acidobacteriota bacterium]